MLYQVLTFLIEVAVTLIGGACLLRLYMRWRRMSMGNPVGRFVQALSDWLVLPLQRIVGQGAQLDVASLLAAWLLKLVQYAALMGLLGLARWSVLPLLALLGVAKLAVSVATAVIIVAGTTKPSRASRPCRRPPRCACRRSSTPPSVTASPTGCRRASGRFRMRWRWRRAFG